jgi:hypothetical protein
MQNLPKIVQARLQRPNPGAAEAHPDANLLTAFAEQSLGESERKHVMEHLAYCGDCREVVAMALPATEAVTVAGSTRAVRDAWLSWPVLRWGVVAAGMVLVTSVGILQYRQRTRQNAAVVTIPVAKEEKVDPASQNTQASAHAAEENAIIAQPPRIAEQPPKRSRAQTAPAANQPSASPNAILSSPPQPLRGAGESGIVGGVFVSSGSTAAPASKNYQTQQSDALALAPRPMEAAPTTTPQTQSAQNRPAAAAQQVEVSGASPMVEVQAESLSLARQDQVQNKQQLAQNQTELPPQKQPLNNLDVVKSKDSVPPQAESSVVFAPMVTSSQIPVQKGMLASPRWAISSTGALQRSFDAGQTWEEVNVTEVALAGRLKAGRAVAYGANVQDEKIKRNKKAESRTDLVFRALAAMGAEVWVGGSGAVLYHSLDSGAHWTRILPSEASAFLTGDVTGLELADPDHARVATSTGEVWITGDRGQTWHKQP